MLRLYLNSVRVLNSNAHLLFHELRPPKVRGLLSSAESLIRWDVKITNHGIFTKHFKQNLSKTGWRVMKYQQAEVGPIGTQRIYRVWESKPLAWHCKTDSECTSTLVPCSPTPLFPSFSSADSPTPPSITSVLVLPAHTSTFLTNPFPFALSSSPRTGSTISWQLLLFWGLVVFSFSFVAFYFSVYLLIPCDKLREPAVERTLN